ncbi:ATPase inhibitor [Escovopsis weberi]|uniref:ATPase inhibitor, mitochondrial n=1 Tax=Escovopsis weberi TaxID=150374 RepID=A0A0M9VU46_ESCWE|nr:ATPase inhibitor [Escovopsis weberi]
MLRTTLPKSLGIRPLRIASSSFSTTSHAMAQGDTGAPPKTGGQGKSLISDRFPIAISIGRQAARSIDSPSPREVDRIGIQQADFEIPRRGNSDAFQQRERANEDFAIRKREHERLLELKKKLAEQRAHLDRLEEHIDEITKNQGGEQN